MGHMLWVLVQMLMAKEYNRSSDLTYFSPTVKKGIAMDWSITDLSDWGEVIKFEKSKWQVVPTRIVDPVFYDKTGSKQNV